MTRVRFVAWLSFLFANSICGTVLAAGLLTNSDFDANVSSWLIDSYRETPDVFEYHWNSFFDADQASTSGSLDTTNIGTHATLGLHQCVAATAGTRYSVGMRTLIASNQSKTGRSELRIYWYSAPGCNSQYINPIEGVETRVVGSWQTVAMDRVAPAGTQSMEIYVGNWPDTDPGIFKVLFDNIYIDVLHSPTVTTFTPNPVFVGQQVTINGIDFYGTTAVRFNNYPSPSFEVKNQRKIVAVAPNGAGTGRIGVVTAGGVGLSPAEETVISPPSISSFNPTFGKPGTTVYIEGLNLEWVTDVRFHNVAAPFTVFPIQNSFAYIRATVPYGATTGTLSVSNGSQGSSSAASFFVVNPTTDFNGDGKADLVWRNNASGNNSMWLIGGASVAFTASLPPVGDPNFKIAGFGDFQGDGKADIVWRNSVTGANVQWLMDGPTILASTVLPNVPGPNWTIAGVGDFQGDHKADILWRNVATGDNSVWLVDGTSMIMTAALPSMSDVNWKIAGIGDFQGDGKDDILWRNEVSGENMVWLMNGTTVAVSATLPTVGDLGWKVAGVGDLQGDGKADVVWRHSVSGDNSIWFMDGPAVAVGATMSSVPDTNWKIVRVADFQGDGKADIMWRNSVTGSNSQWLMAGSGIALGSTFPPVSDVNWQVAGPP